MCDAKLLCGRLQNSVMLSDLPEQQHNSLFSDVPSQTNVLVHDIDVGKSLPINPAIVEYLHQNYFTTPSESPWGSP